MHEWKLSPQEAIQLQHTLREKVKQISAPARIRYIAGTDVSLNRFEDEVYAGIIVLAYPSMEIVEEALYKGVAPMPYIPGLLSFREIPALMKCWEKLKIRPDIVMVDGQGIAHPRRLGIAAHFGVLIDTPTIGVAKSRLYGAYNIPVEVGEATAIIDPKNGEVIGKALKSKARSNPLLISPGHLMDIDGALRITKECLQGYRLPEPTRQAHLLVNRFRQGECI